MFDSLDEQMKIDDNKASTSRERALKWVLVCGFGGRFWWTLPGRPPMEGS